MTSMIDPHSLSLLVYHRQGDQESMTKFERDKVYKTRDGREARVICVDAPGDFPLVVLVGKDPPYKLHADGRWWPEGSGNTMADLMLPKPEPIVEWGYMDGDKFERCSSECGARHFVFIDGASAKPRRLAKRTTEILD